MHNIGKKYGLLTIVDRKREKGRTYYFCKCDCGNEKWIRADMITSGKQKGCGCLSKTTRFKINNLENRKFGRLTVLKDTSKRDKRNGAVIWECKCECGNIVEVEQYSLLKGLVVSCGCYKKEILIDNGKKVGALHVKNNIIEDTNLQVLTSNKIMKHNTSGTTGVLWDKSREKWKAEIIFKKKKYYLGRYDNKEDAVAARKEAEERLHKEFLREKGIIEQ